MDRYLKPDDWIGSHPHQTLYRFPLSKQLTNWRLSALQPKLPALIYVQIAQLSRLIGANQFANLPPNLSNQQLNALHFRLPRNYRLFHITRYEFSNGHNYRPELGTRVSHTSGSQFSSSSIPWPIQSLHLNQPIVHGHVIYGGLKSSLTLFPKIKINIPHSLCCCFYWNMILCWGSFPWPPNREFLRIFSSSSGVVVSFFPSVVCMCGSFQLKLLLKLVSIYLEFPLYDFQFVQRQ